MKTNFDFLEVPQKTIASTTWTAVKIVADGLSEWDWYF